MALSFFQKCHLSVRRLESNFLALIFGRIPPADFCAIELVKEQELAQKTQKKFSLSDLIGDGFLYAVPKFRRTVERRWKRKFGNPEYVWKPLVPRTNLQICNTCGHDHEIGLLCGHCYAKIQEETKLMQDKIQSELGLNPIEKEVVVLYAGEKEQQPKEYWEGKRIVEVEKTRPSWFSKNLLQRTTQAPATTKGVKPSDLG